MDDTDRACEYNKGAEDDVVVQSGIRVVIDQLETKIVRGSTTCRQRKESKNVNATFRLPTWNAPTPLLPHGDAPRDCQSPRTARQQLPSPPLTRSALRSTHPFHSQHKQISPIVTARTNTSAFE